MGERQLGRAGSPLPSMLRWPKTTGCWATFFAFGGRPRRALDVVTRRESRFSRCPLSPVVRCLHAGGRHVGVPSGSSPFGCSSISSRARGWRRSSRRTGRKTGTRTGSTTRRGTGSTRALLSPQRYSSRGHRFDLLRLTRFLEVFAYFSPAHAYSLHVSFLGLFPILMSSNEALKREAVAKLEGGGLFAFGGVGTGPRVGPVRQRVHGDASGVGRLARRRGEVLHRQRERGVHRVGPGQEGDERHRARPSGRRSCFFALRPAEAPAYRNVRKIRTLGIRPAFVGEFEVHGHPVPDGDVISRGPRGVGRGLRHGELRQVLSRVRRDRHLRARLRGGRRPPALAGSSTASPSPTCRTSGPRRPSPSPG